MKREMICRSVGYSSEDKSTGEPPAYALLFEGDNQDKLLLTIPATETPPLPGKKYLIQVN